MEEILKTGEKEKIDTSEVREIQEKQRDDDAEDFYNKYYKPKNPGIVRRQEVKVSERVKALMELPDVAWVDLDLWSIVIRKHKFDPNGVAKFLKQNGLDTKHLKDVVFGIVVVKLVDAGIVNPTRDDTMPDEATDNGDTGYVDQVKLNWFAPLARTVMVVALHHYSQGSIHRKISWYDSFVAVKGSFISENRLAQLSKLIIGSNNLEKVCKLITVGELKTENKLLQYRLTRLSTPGLIRTAVTMLPFDAVLKYFEPDSLAMYRRFDEAGIVAQIAAGPLSAYCKGEVDPFLGDMIPDDIRISDLKAIKEIPYEPKVIKKAYIILQEVGFHFGKWYQGEKAMKTPDVFDLHFRAVVRAVNNKLKNTGVNNEPKHSAVNNKPKDGAVNNKLKESSMDVNISFNDLKAVGKDNEKHVEKVSSVVRGWF